MSENLLKNGNFEQDWGDERSHRCLVFESDRVHEQEIGNIFTPPGWVTWFHHKAGEWDQPEVRDAHLSVDSTRVDEGKKGILLFTFFRRHDAGFMQQVQVEPGTELHFSARAHAWSNSKDGDHADDARWSEGPGHEAGYCLEGHAPNDDWANFTFSVGIDPTGGIDPLSDRVIWGQGAHIYNEYADVPSVTAVAEADTVTVFLRSKTAWPFKHNDAYWDNAELTATGAQNPPPNDPGDGATKLGAHVLRSAADLGDYVAAKPAVVKLVGEWGMAADLPEGVLAIGRKHQADYDAQHQYKEGMSPADAARQFVEDQADVYRANPQIAYWEGHNEPIWNTPEEMAWYAQFEIERMKCMANVGLRCVIGNFATGTPDLALWEQFLPAIEAGLEYEALLGVHEYSCPWMWWMTGKHQVDPSEDQGDEGWTTLRYRKVYRQWLIPRGLVIPLVITECGIDPLVNPKPEGAPGGTWKDLGDFWEANDLEPDKHDYYFRQLVWYDQELQKDDYVVGATIFTWGNFGAPWSSFDVAGTPVAEKLVAYTQEHPANSFEYPDDNVAPPPPVDGFVPPRIPYSRTYVLLPQMSDPVEAMEWRTAAAIGSAAEMRTVGHSADDAGVGPKDRTVIAVNPDTWGDLQGFFDEHYPGAEVLALYAGTPWEMAVKLRPILTDDIALAQQDPEWKDYDFGEQPGGGTIGGYGCLLTGLAIILRKVYHRAITPPVLDKLLCAARAAFVNDNILGWVSTAKLFPAFDRVVKDNAYRTADQLAEMLDGGWEIVLRRADGAHFVYLESVEDDGLHIIDTWDGKRKVRPALDYFGVRAVHVASEVAPPPPPSSETFPLMGIHGVAGGEYLADQGVQGWCLEPVYMNEDYQRLDYTHLADQGIRVIVNLRRSWSNDCGGQGTVPPPDKWDRFIENAVRTIRDAKGVYAVTLFNEVNNPREWPSEGCRITPADVAHLYNEIYHQVKDLDVKVGLGALDPFFGPGSNCMEWWQYLLSNIVGAQVFGLHGYTRGPDPAMVGNQVKFGNAPLEWQFVNFPGCVQTFLDELDGRFPRAEVFITEYNHLWLESEMFPACPTIGWRPDATAVLDAAFEAAASLRYVTALIAYRWSGDDWRLHDKPVLLRHIAGLNR